MPDSQPQEPEEPDRGGATAPGPAALVLCGARLIDGRTVDVRIGGGRIEAVDTTDSFYAQAPAPLWHTRVDLSGYLLLPAPAEPHAHHDTALTAAPGGAPAPSPTLSPALSPGPSSALSAYAPGGPYAPEQIQRRTCEAALLQLGHGATALRTHVRIGGAAGLASLRAVLRARQALRGLADLTTVAVPRVLTGAAGADGRAMLRDAVRMGASAVGGCPDLDPDPVGCAEAVLEVAAEYGCAVDLHTDGGDPAWLPRFAAMANGLPGVTIGPCDGLAALPREAAVRAAESLATAEITVVCLPQGRCGLLGRTGRGPHTAGTPARTTPVRLLRAAGVRVAAGSGALRDVANPVGRGDPLGAAYLLASRGEADPEAAYEAVSVRAREALGLPEVRIEPGFPAELLAVRGDTLAGALSLAYSRLVVHRGRVVARTSAVREYCDTADPADVGDPADTAGAVDPGGTAESPVTEPGLPRQSQR